MEPTCDHKTLLEHFNCICPISPSMLFRTMSTLLNILRPVKKCPSIGCSLKNNISKTKADISFDHDLFRQYRVTA